MSKTIADLVSEASLRAPMDGSVFFDSGAEVPDPGILERLMRIKLPACVRVQPMTGPVMPVWNDVGQASTATAALIHLGPKGIDPVAVLQAMIDQQVAKAPSRQHVFCPLWALFSAPDGSWKTRSAWVVL